MKHRSRLHPFTLIELVVALSVFSVLMLLLIRFLGTTERAWSLNQTEMTMFENQRVVLELIERDLNTAVASSLPGREIGFYIADPDDADTEGLVCTFVAASSMNENADYRLCEISYRVTGNRLERQLITFNDGEDWDFYGQTATSEPDWVVDNLSADKQYEALLLNGVSDLHIQFYESGEDIYPLAVDTTVFELPVRAEVTLVLHDPVAAQVSAQKKQATETPFAKGINLNKFDASKVE